MKKQYASILLTLTCFLGLGVGAEGQSQREVVVTVPYEFVAGGKTLSAGTYTVTRVSEDRFGGLIISSYENRSSAVVMPNEFESYPADNIKVSFKQIDDVHFLSKIETANGAYNIPVPHSADYGCWSEATRGYVGFWNKLNRSVNRSLGDQVALVHHA